MVSEMSGEFKFLSAGKSCCVLPVVLSQADADSTGTHLPTSIGVGDLAFLPRLDVLPHLHYICICSVFDVIYACFLCVFLWLCNLV